MEYFPLLLVFCCVTFVACHQCLESYKDVEIDAKLGTVKCYKLLMDKVRNLAKAKEKCKADKNADGERAKLVTIDTTEKLEALNTNLNLKELLANSAVMGFCTSEDVVKAERVIWDSLDEIGTLGLKCEKDGTKFNFSTLVKLRSSSVVLSGTSGTKMGLALGEKDVKDGIHAWYFAPENEKFYAICELPADQE